MRLGGIPFMTTEKPNTPGARTLPFPLNIRAIVFAILFMASFGICVSGQAQSIQPRPVARLLSDPVADANYSRPRRVEASHHATSAAPAFEVATDIERRAFDQTNAARVENGLEPLTWDPELCRMARLHSERMASLKFFSHETPDGSQLRDRAQENGILHFRVIGENIAYNKGYDDPGGFAVERWLLSSGHRANILFGGFQSSAIGSYVAADGSTYLTQVFIAR
jgi:uncharacterized protein YkwD